MSPGTRSNTRWVCVDEIAAPFLGHEPHGRRSTNLSAFILRPQTLSLSTPRKLGSGAFSFKKMNIARRAHI